MSIFSDVGSTDSIVTHLFIARLIWYLPFSRICANTASSLTLRSTTRLYGVRNSLYTRFPLHCMRSDIGFFFLSTPSPDAIIPVSSMGSTWRSTTHRFLSSTWSASIQAPKSDCIWSLFGPSIKAPSIQNFSVRISTSKNVLSVFQK